MKKKIIIGLIIFFIMLIITFNFVSDELDGKTIAFLGDSLIEGYGNDFRSFEYYWKDILPNSKFINNSKSGSTVTNNTGTDNIVMINQVKTLTRIARYNNF